MGENFIGSHISLVTKSDLRYEGILTEIDIVESTITLKNVRAFGDEGRRPQAPQPASDKVFELILFKADDIQDLTVITQQAQAPPTPANPTYPAPYNYGAPPPAQAPMAQPPSTYNQGPWGAPPPAANTQPYAPLYGSNQWSVTPAPPSQPPPPAQRAAPPPPPPAAGSTPAVAPTVSIAPKTVPKDTAPPAPPAKPSNWAQAVGGGRGGGRGHAANGSAAAGGAGRGGPAGGRGGPAPPAPGRAPMAPHHVPSRTGVPAGPPGQPRPAPGAAPPIPVPAEEYDFQAANEKFKKDELAKEVEETAKDPVYKKDDFFDMLSCEALTHRDVTGIDGRARVEQKQRDMETFGGLGGVRHTSFNRGRGRGPMHGGGQGGRGGPMQTGGQGRGYGGGGRGGDNRMGGRGGAAGGPGRGGYGGQGRGGGRGGPRQDHR